MILKQLLNGIEGIKAKGNLELDIKKVEMDSRKIEKDSMFVAIKGFEADGHQYIEDAIKKGASVIVIENGFDLKTISFPEELTVLIVENTRKALAKIACNFYDNPSKKFKLIGITGTKGKTTTTFMIKSILEKTGQKVGLIGTIATYIGNEKLHNNDRTTPDSLELQQIFQKMVEEKVDTVVMEVSSQSLKLDRVYGTDFDICAFTNFSKDHISEKEHPNMEDYFESKAKLFDMCKIAFVNADDIYTKKILKMNKNCEIKTYGIDNYCNILAKDITIMNSGADFKVKIGEKNERVKVSIPGRFTVYNALVSIAITTALGANADQIREAMQDIRVPGRNELVNNKLGLTIMIDYAHSPNSLENIICATKTYAHGDVIVVFGCGGNRDASKRPLMGKIAGELADYTIITSDNPRYEDPKEIIKQIEEGIKTTKGKYTCIEDRKEAIKQAIKMATRRDVIILAGKGHEPYQEIKGEKSSFDEREIVKKIIANM